MTDPEVLEIVEVCQEMLARQDRLIANLKKEGRDASDAVELRREIIHLLDMMYGAILLYEARWNSSGGTAPR